MCVHVYTYVCVHLYTYVCASDSPLLFEQQKEEWMERRTLKRDKQELLDLQLSLKNEVGAKTSVQQQLTQVTSQLAEMEK